MRWKGLTVGEALVPGFGDVRPTILGGVDKDEALCPAFFEVNSILAWGVGTGTLDLGSLTVTVTDGCGGGFDETLFNAPASFCL
jgi:hypothetical protein